MENILIEFADNRFRGWYSWLFHFENILKGKDYPSCESLVNETLHSGYAFTAEEILDLRAYGDLIVYHSEGIEGLLRHGKERLNLPESDGPAEDRKADRHFRLGLIHQKYGAEQQQNRVDSRVFFQAARAHYEQCREYRGSDADRRILPHIGLLLHTLGILEDRGELHEFFLSLWRSVMKAEFTARAEFQSMASDALVGNDWRRAREAISVLESVQDAETLSKGLDNTMSQVRIAVVSALRRMQSDGNALIPIDTLDDSSALVRWQAVRGIGESGAHEQFRLGEILKQDEDADVRIAAAEAIGKVGDRRMIDVLKNVREVAGTLGVWLPDVAKKAVRSIENRYPM